MKKTKKFLALLLCVMLLCSVAVIPVHAEEVGDHEHVWGNGQWTTDGYDCILGYCHSYYETCSICGAVHYIAYREWDSKTGSGAHTWETREVSTDCPVHPTLEKTCSSCGQTETVRGGHNWSGWITTTEGSCTVSKVESRTCLDCSATEERVTGGNGHNWRLESSTSPTCTEPGSVVKVCSTCGERVTETSGAPLGHHYPGEVDCTEQHTCSRCGQTNNGYAHSWGEYVVTDRGHYQKCRRCQATSALTSHSDSGNGYCVCGKQVSCSHDWQVTSSYGLLNHYEKCSKCGDTRLVSCVAAGREQPRQYCTDKTYCECGNVIKDGQKNHNFGTWRCTDSTHTHACLNSNCQYGQTPEPHTFQTTSSGLRKCSVCNYTDPTSRNTHTHVWGVWTSSGASSHSHSCTIPGCNATETGSHNFGAANCKGEAVCADCGATVTGRPAGTHSGGTEIRDAKAATTESKGYTGDTYCLGCGQKISSGSSIPALPSSHTHSYASTWSKDGTHHWKDCSCGDRKDYAEHTFKDGKCTVCGAADPNYKAPQDHVHSWNTGWTTSATEHWHTCSGCAETADRGEHVVITEGSVQKCGVCGITLGEIEELEKEEQKPDTQKPDTQEPDTQEPDTQKPDTQEPDTQKPDTQKPDTQKPSTKEEFAKEAVKQFNDVVKEDAFYAAPVGWAVQNSITNGTSEEAKTFSPDKTCTQAEILTMLYRAARIAEDPSFKPDGSDMKAAQTWAAENGIIGADFDPNADCTRAIAVFFMWKAADCPEAEGGVTFNDVTGDFEQAVAWAQAKGITNGTNLEKGLFSPDKTCNRGEIVTFLYRDQVEPLA